MAFVDKTNRTIKAILDKSVGEGWLRGPKGREISVEEVDPSWTFETNFDWNDPDTHVGSVYLVSPDGKSGYWVEHSATAPTKAAPTSHLALLIATFVAKPGQRRRTVTIYIPQLDHAQMDVARDALLVGDKKLIATALEPFGLYAGIARAILERQIRSFAKAAHPKKSTKQIRREVDDFLRAQGRL